MKVAYAFLVTASKSTAYRSCDFLIDLWDGLCFNPCMNDKWMKYGQSLDNDANTLFLTFAKMRGYNAQKSRPEQDMFAHIDYFITHQKNGLKLSVDIKGAKRHSDDGLFLVELKNVRGDRGWLFGRADIIAFQYRNSFVMVRRNDLFALVKSKMGLEITTKEGFNINVTKGMEGYNRLAICPSWYRRGDRPLEMVTFLEIQDIEKIKTSI